MVWFSVLGLARIGVSWFQNLRMHTLASSVISAQGAGTLGIGFAGPGLKGNHGNPKSNLSTPTVHRKSKSRKDPSKP